MSNVLQFRPRQNTKAFCLRCSAWNSVVGMRAVTMANGRTVDRGKCATCAGDIYKLHPRPEDPRPKGKYVPRTPAKESGFDIVSTLALIAAVIFVCALVSSK